MKAAFFFDTFLIEDNKNFFGMTLTYDFFKNRYLKYFENIIVSTRVKSKTSEKGNISGYKKTNGRGVDVIPIRSYNSVFDALRNKRKIEKEISKVLDKCDVAIIRLPSVIGNIACSLCRKKNIKYKIEMVACAWDGYINHHNSFGKIIAPIMYFVTRHNVKKAEEVLYVTSKFLQRRYPTLGNEVACSDVVLAKYEDEVLNNRIKKIQSMSMSKIKLCTVANVGLKYKGQEFVIKALYNLKSKGINNYIYYLIGNGDKTYLKELISKYKLEKEVVFLGSLNHDQVFEKLDEMDIYIQPSLQEGLPRALLEAMSRACPSIGSNAGGIEELLNKKYVFNKKDVKRIEKILSTIDKKDLVEMAKFSIEKTKEFDLEKLNDLRNEFYKK